MNTSTPHIARRDPAIVMRLQRLGSLHQCRLSFMRVLTRRLAQENWQFSRPVFDIDANGVGHAVYTAQGPKRTYSLVAFAHDLPPDMRSDRVIATAWDATFTLFDGVPDADDIQRLSENVPLQEAGRVSEKEISVSRANRSVRLWAHFVDALASGQQPDQDKIDAVGYLMRTTAVYGSGKLGAMDREGIAGRDEMVVPFQAEMLSVFLTRAFVRDLVQHMANAKGGPDAVQLAPDIARQLGIGNSTGLGMAPFIINHPILFNNWIIAREEAIARVRSQKAATEAERKTFTNILQRSEASVDRWHSEHPIQIEKLKQLRADFATLGAYIEGGVLRDDSPWDKLMLWAGKELSIEGQEFVASLILEPYGDLVDGLAVCMADSNADAFAINGAMSVAQCRALIEKSFGWAFDIDWTAKENRSRAWYVSEEKLEPRLGERFDEPIEDYEQPLAPARDAVAAHVDLASFDDDQPIAAFLLQHPEHRHTIRRAQMSGIAPYGEIHDNTICATVLPIDMLRAKLSFFGATHFDPRSDRWVRICMYAGAPYPEDLTDENADLWVYPEVTQ
ncbi:hypothetical protein K3X41_06555 [Aliiroseovarius crassostreae]|uniref:hypothetical protein n=2 Tax=Aliiroseovarius crassostreae TaxID=154981 RepID=UPI002201B982|nr:hypothetical protein [Aliiroseovarius crassostreae]UWQ09238.1 hypothetical protein K3X25_06700 [Aliiroseovarius crassostreae]UWQ12314.1 hypothetical protein K3X41_06555 [Aliiroseovarius crassostreae]